VPAVNRPCDACGSTDAVRLLEKDGYPVVRCARCGLVYVDAVLGDADIERIYGREYYTGAVFDEYMAEQDARLALARSRVRRLRRRRPEGALLDVGCAAGYFLEAAKDSYAVTGVEVSAYAADYARTTFGHRVVTGEIGEAGFPGAAFDVVTLWDTVEHLREPSAVLGEIGRVTRPGGLLALTTGDVESRLARRDLRRWDLMTPPWHLFFFSADTLGRVLAKAGFRIERISRDGFVSARPRLRTWPVALLMAALGQGNVMTVYARRT